MDNKNVMYHALEIAKKGWPVIPLHDPGNGRCSCSDRGCKSAGKHPRTKNGCKDASLDPARIGQWWANWPGANVGILTGKTSGLVVIDIDPRHGGDKSWHEFREKHSLRPTMSVKSGGGGQHLYYRYPTSGIRNKTNILPGVDIRGEGGYIIGPPSKHLSGGTYTWENDAPIQDFPRELYDLIHSSCSAKSNKINRGSRNTTLFSLGGLLRRQGLESTGIQAALTAVNEKVCEEPLPPTEVHTIAKSASRYETLRVVNEDRSWSDPQPLPDGTISVPEMNSEHLPEALRAWASDICERMQIPLEFVAAPTIVSLSSVIGRKTGIHPKSKDDWLVIPNLWGGVIARPGFFKSPAIAEALKPLEALVKKERVRYEAALIVAKSKEDVIKAKIDGLKESVRKAVRKGMEHDLAGLESQLAEAIQELETVSASEKRFKTNDATIEKIGALLVENPNGILIVRDELAGWLKSLDKSGREGDREFFLESWNGYGSFTVDRIGRGTLHIPSLCLSIFGGLQPGKLNSYIAQALYSGAGDDGLLQRFQLLMYPEAPKSWRNIDRVPDLESRSSVFELFGRIASLSNGDGNQVTAHFTQEAQELFNSWREGFETRLREKSNETPAFESHLAKYRSLVPSLALIFHLCDGEVDRSTVGADSLTLALHWATILERHAQKVYSSLIQADLTAAQALSKKIKEGKVKDGCSLRSIYRKCWSHLESSKQVDMATSYLEDLGWVRVVQQTRNHGLKQELRINPKLSNNNR